MMRMKLQLFATKKNTAKLANPLEEVAKALVGAGAKASTGVGAISGGAKASAGLNALAGGAVAGAKATAGTPKAQNAVYTGSGKEVATNLPLSSNYTPQLVQTAGGINGVDKATQDKMQSTFSESEKTQNAQKEADSYLNNVKQLGSVTDIIGQDTWDALNQKWQQPQAVTDAFNFTNGLLEQLTSGRTSYTDQIKELMGQIQNREKFSYDVDSDTLFQQSLASAMGSGRTAMQDTIGQASALTGGYGSTYATTAGNQAYNSFIQDAYNNLPEYYQMALEAYQMEGDEMYKQLGMLNDADATEYQRMYNSWQANYNNANSMYERAYGEWGDSVNNAYNSANLQLNEHGQLFDQAYKTYGAVADNAQMMYQNEYNKWADEVNNAFRFGDMANSDYWNTTNFNEEVRQFNSTMSQRQAEHNAEMSYKNRALAQDQNQFTAKMTAEQKEAQAKKDEEASKLTSPSKVQMDDALRIRNEQGEEAYIDYLEQLDVMGIDVAEVDMHVEANRNVPWTEHLGSTLKDSWNNLWK